MILILRGHIRDSFLTKDLYNLVKSLKSITATDDFHIYIFTWSILQSSKSWRSLQQIDTKITKELILNYFQDLKLNIRHISIEEEANISLIGSTDGNIGIGPCPKLAWKNYWFSLNKITTQVLQDHQTYVINMRFDILSNFNKELTPPFEIISKAIAFSKEKQWTQNKFILDKACCGIDNIIFGSASTQQALAAHFHNNLDEILRKPKYANIRNQELLVYFENENYFL